MTLTPGVRLGPYEVTTAIGAGGMGEVFRARDTKLDRDVALKVLPSELAQDRERLARFEREAKLLASLNHSNIAHVYGFESVTMPDGSTLHFLAMELVEGDDLSERLKRGAVPLDESIGVARQIAEGLEEAHAHGIIHRDLKPANIKIAGGGRVKILDFGLAKAYENDAPGTAMGSQLSRSPTISRHMTETGMILGTAAYMSPEQARGKPLDKRTDIWAFGVVLYEMLTGQRAFTGDDVTEVLAAVIRDTPNMKALPAGTPEPIRRLLRRCLEKDRGERLADIGAARLEIKDALSGAAEVVKSADAAGPGDLPARRLTPSTVFGMTLLTAVVAGALTMSLAPLWNERTVDPGVIRFPLIGDPRIRVTSDITQPFAISPDGNTIVFSGNSTGRTHLWVRTLDDPKPRILDDTEGAMQPAISPDGEWVAFVVANHVIRKVRIKGGGATTIASISDITAAIAWGEHDDIVFELIGSNTGIQRVSANGGTPELLIPLDAAAHESRQRRPFVLRDEHRVLYTSIIEPEGAAAHDVGTTLAVFSPEDGRRVHLPIEGVQALGIISGHLIFSRADGALMAVPFDARAMEVRGPARQLAERVGASFVGTAVTMSPGGTLVYQLSGSRASRLMFSDVGGQATPLGNWIRAFGEARLSPDGRRVAVGIVPGVEGEGLWMLDRNSAEPTRIAGPEDANLVGWAPDGKALVSLRGNELWATPVDGSHTPTMLVRVEGSVQAADLSPDGRFAVVVRRLKGPTTQELIRVGFDAPESAVTLVPSASAGGSLRPDGPRISPDGKWVAFMDETLFETHVRSTSGGGAIQVSDEGGGEHAVWGGPSGPLFFGRSDWLVEAELQTTPMLAVKRRQKLLAWAGLGSVLDISSDGKTFLVSQPVAEGPEALVAFNWAASVRRQLQGSAN